MTHWPSTAEHLGHRVNRLYSTHPANTIKPTIKMGAAARPCVVMRVMAAIAHAVNATIVVRRTRRLRRSLIVSGMVYLPGSGASPTERISSHSMELLETSSIARLRLAYHATGGSIANQLAVNRQNGVWDVSHPLPRLTALERRRRPLRVRMSPWLRTGRVRPV